MKHLEIIKGNVVFRLNESELVEKKLENITQHEIKLLLTSAYKDDEFNFDENENNIEIVNPLEKIIYTHLIDQIRNIRSSRESAISEVNSYYSMTLGDYKKKDV